MTDFAAHELLDMHEWVDSCARGVKKIRIHAPQIQDSQLRQIAQTCESSKERAIGEAQRILGGGR
jgi:hypothetical protein